jgi:hypothetical protein
MLCFFVAHVTCVQLCSNTTWTWQRFVDYPMYARATPSFHKQPWFSDVPIQMEVVGEQKKISYGQLHLLFKMTCT